MAELTGQSFAGYEILAKLGEGGMGAVYKAKQPILNRFVALKTMAAHLGGDKEFVARFQREAASAATLNHPNVVGVHTAGEVDGTHYIVMEFVEGESVRKRLDREGRIPPAEALAITIYVAQALQYAWNKARLIHRDIKPDNIFLSSAGEVKVGDLGLAKSLATEGTEMTATGMAMGSPHYISPEQATGIKDIDFRTDIYSLGCTLYHMLTGQTPYKGDSSMVVMMKHVHDPAPAIFKAWPQCPMPLGMLVGRMLAKDRNARPKSYEQLVADLFAVSEKLQQAAAPAPAPVPVVTSKPAVVEKTAAATQALAPSPDAPTVALQPSAKPKNLTAIYAAVGVITVIALAGLLLWSPWKTPSTVRDEDASVGHAARTGTAATTPAGDADGFVSLFNGKDLTGWEGRPEFWSVQDGAICGATTKEARAQKNTFLVCTAGEFGDFELRAQFKLAAGDEQGVVNTGVQYRSQIIDREYFTLSGYQADLGFSGKKNLSGGFWEEAGRSVPATPGQRLILREGASPQSPKKTIEFIGSTDDILASYKENDWNDLTVIASGNRLQHYLNGKLASEVIDETAAAASTGTLALQIKTGPPMRVWFRNLFIKKLGSAASATPSLQYSTVASASDTGWQNTINLLPLIDPQKDAVKGSWTLVNGELISSPAYNARLEMPYRPPEEYAFRIVFSRRKGEWDIHQMFPSEGRAFLWAMATASNKRCGFMEFQPDAVRRLTWLDGSLANGQRYTSVVEVRKESFRAHLDGKPITEWRIAPSNPQGTVSAVSVPPRDPTLLGVGSYNSDVVFHRIEVREVTGKGTFTRGAPPNADAAWQNAINLLPLIDPQKDAAGGKWTWSGNTLVSDSAQNGRIAIPYQPPQEYDYRLMFHYTKGYTPTDAGQVIQILSKNGRLFSWIMGAKKGEFIAFETIAGANSADRANPTIIQRKPALRKNVTYTSLVEVRNDGLKAYLNGELLAQYKTDYKDMDIVPHWKLPDPTLLGVGSWLTAMVIEKLEVREVTGKGTFTRGTPAVPSSTPALQHSNLSPAALSAFCAEVAALPAEQQVARVVAKLKELNPGYDGKETHKIEGNDVVDLEISAINVTDISPVNALRKLRRFVCVASTDGKKRSHLSDLTPLQGLSLAELRVPGCDVSDLSVVRGMPLDHLGILHTRISDLSPLQGAPLTVINCDEAMAMMPHNLAVLRSIKTLKMINISAQRFWRQVEAGELSKAK